MIIHNAPQGSEAWEQIRKGRATASDLNRILTPAKLQFAAGAVAYAAEKVAELLQVESTLAPPSYWMDRGTEMEPFARLDFANMTGKKVEEVGFILPHEDARFGASVDGLVDDDAILEIKCPSAENLILWHYDGFVPKEHRLQIQGGLFASGRKRAAFFAWHPDIVPLIIWVERDEEMIAKIADSVIRFNGLVDGILSKVQRRTSSIVYKPDVELEGFDD